MKEYWEKDGCTRTTVWKRISLTSLSPLFMALNAVTKATTGGSMKQLITRITGPNRLYALVHITTTNKSVLK